MSRWRRISPYLLAGLLMTSGVLHFAAASTYEQIVPPQLPARRFLVYVSGVAELVCALAVAAPRTRRIGGWASAALFVAVFPANIFMALDSSRSAGVHALAVARLPLQVPLVAWAVQVARSRPLGRRL